MPDHATVQAHRLIAAGSIAEALTLVTAAADAGDVDASMQLAVWHLTNEIMPRDLPTARALLRRTVEIGHVDAALMEIAMVANGSGGPVDWAAAHALLGVAARHDAVAAAQLSLVSAMDIDAEGRPRTRPSGRILSSIPKVTVFPGLFSPGECAHVANVAAALLEPARVIDSRTGSWILHPVRTSDGAAIGPGREDLVVRALNHRIAAISRTSVAQGEPLTVLRYRPGQQYKLHVDTIADAANQRMMTVLIYLNQGFAGGETFFPVSDLMIRPCGGDAILFANTTAYGLSDYASRHAGLPVRQGVKWLATRWIRAQSINPWSIG